MTKTIVQQRKDFIEYMRWLVEFWDLDRRDLERINKFVEDITEEKHDPYQGD